MSTNSLSPTWRDRYILIFFRRSPLARRRRYSIFGLGSMSSFSSFPAVLNTYDSKVRGMPRGASSTIGIPLLTTTTCCFVSSTRFSFFGKEVVNASPGAKRPADMRVSKWSSVRPNSLKSSALLPGRIASNVFVVGISLAIQPRVNASPQARWNTSASCLDRFRRTSSVRRLKRPGLATSPARIFPQRVCISASVMSSATLKNRTRQSSSTGSSDTSSGSADRAISTMFSMLLCR
ncbi:MAG: hypothetical protein FD131_1099 [Rhodocyclaceae bacterium]|nr:MAG: hypothetical protein FD131_1099 [Rhodocyclaceae bacterium]